MTFDTTTIGLLLFYTVGALLAVAFGLLALASTREGKRKTSASKA